MRDINERRITKRDMRREATKAAVLEAAKTVFLADGYERATIKAIGDQAGVSPGTVLNAEPSKAGLLVAILSDQYEAMAESADRMEASLSGAVADRITGLMHLMLDAHHRHASLFAAAIGHGWLVSDPAFQDAFQRMRFAWGALRRVLEAGVRSGELRADLDVEPAVSVLIDVFTGVFRETQREDGHDAAAALSARISVVLDGMKAC